MDVVCVPSLGSCTFQIVLGFYFVLDGSDPRSLCLHGYGIITLPLFAFVFVLTETCIVVVSASWVLVGMQSTLCWFLCMI